jgi:ectoine hydroxylase-related dioxygenase (phytanoyl-CoA dioxygenase family)
VIGEQDRQRFQTEGFVVLERIMSDAELSLVRAQCQRFMDQKDREMDAAGVDVLGLDQRGKRYFVNDCSTVSPELQSFVLGDLMARICRTLLGDEVYLFNDQYVVKGAEGGTHFGWHQDSGYVGYPHAPYLTCWCALDDMSEANGTVYLLPYGAAGTRDVVPHVRDARNNDLVGYTGAERGVAVEVPAGSIACFSSTVFHRSGSNTTPRLRRAYIVQYSTEPILTADRSALRHQAVPFRVAGRE